MLSLTPAGVATDNLYVNTQSRPRNRSEARGPRRRRVRHVPRLAGAILNRAAELTARSRSERTEQGVFNFLKKIPPDRGELRAIPAMLPIGYLENVQRMASRASREVADRASVDAWVSRLIDAGPAGPSDRRNLAEFVHRGPDLTPHFSRDSCSRFAAGDPTSRRCCGSSSGSPKTS